jgi:hypothetical protein
MAGAARAVEGGDAAATLMPLNDVIRTLTVRQRREPPLTDLSPTRVAAPGRYFLRGIRKVGLDLSQGFGPLPKPVQAVEHLDM